MVNDVVIWTETTFNKSYQKPNSISQIAGEEHLVSIDFRWQTTRSWLCDFLISILQPALPFLSCCHITFEFESDEISTSVPLTRLSGICYEPPDWHGHGGHALAM